MQHVAAAGLLRTLCAALATRALAAEVLVSACPEYQGALQIVDHSASFQLVLNASVVGSASRL